MKKLLFIIMPTFAFLYSCQQKQSNQITEVGSFDSSTIATDTGMEKAIEGSYEYSKTLAVSPKLVYDIIAYGGPASEGQYSIVRRGPDNKPDTLVTGKREGIIKDAWLTRMNHTHRNEIVLVIRSADKSYEGNLIIYAVDDKDELGPIKFNTGLGELKAAGYAGNDSFYISGDELVREFPIHNSGRAIVHYEMKNAELTSTNFETK